MMKFKNRLLLLGLFFVTLAACEKNNVEEITQEQTGGCDTLKAISFKNQIEPLFKTECGSQGGCHGSGSAFGGVNLEDSQKILSVVQSGLLMNSINHEVGISPMPKGRPKLDQCRINILKKWIREGVSFSN